MTGFRAAMIAAGAATAMAGAILSGSGALAADNTLAPGKPAGVHQAARSPNLLLMGGAIVVAAVAVVVATQSSNNSGCGSACATPTTGTNP